MSATEKKPPKQKNIHLIVLAAVSGLVALLLFLDAFVPILPDSMNLGGGHSEGDESAGETGEDETKKHWWEGIFDRNHPMETEPPAEDDLPWTEDGEPVPRPTPSVSTPELTESLVYTEDEMLKQYYAAVVKALNTLKRMEASGEMEPILEVGLFNLDSQGDPEIVVKTGLALNRYSYSAYDLQVNRVRFRWEESAGAEPSLWVGIAQNQPSSFASILTVHGDGDDEVIWLLSANDKDELLAVIREGDNVRYRVDGKTADEEEYAAACARFAEDYVRLDGADLYMRDWQVNDVKLMAEELLTGGRKFVKP